MSSTLRISRLSRSGKSAATAFRKSRRPINSRPSLERLEDRNLLSVGTAFFGPVNSPTVNAALQDSGLIVVAVTQLQGHGNGTLGVNGSGVGNLLQPTSTPLWIPGSFGVGSGTQPGQPWAPAAYTIGLTNRPISFPTAADQGIQPTPPWGHVAADESGDEEVIVAEEDTENPSLPSGDLFSILLGDREAAVVPPPDSMTDSASGK
jgi:hypothetical protein